MSSSCDGTPHCQCREQILRRVQISRQLKVIIQWPRFPLQPTCFESLRKYFVKDDLSTSKRHRVSDLDFVFGTTPAILSNPGKYTLEARLNS